MILIKIARFPSITFKTAGNIFQPQGMNDFAEVSGNLIYRFENNYVGRSSIMIIML